MLDLELSIRYNLFIEKAIAIIAIGYLNKPEEEFNEYSENSKSITAKLCADKYSPSLDG
jgi:hypothetical protein